VNSQYHCVKCGKTTSDKRSKQCRDCAHKAMIVPESLCIDCGNILSKKSYTRCRSCRQKLVAIPKRFCLDCKKPISRKSKLRCRPCNAKRSKSMETRNKISVNLMGKKSTRNYREHPRKSYKMKTPRSPEHIKNIVEENYRNGTYDPIGSVRKQGNQGYFIIKTRTDSGEQNWVSYHRYLMEQKIGRKLATGEHVHHIDGDKSNNDISNLALLTASQHYTLNYLITKLNLPNSEGFAKIVLVTLQVRYPEMFGEKR